MLCIVAWFNPFAWKLEQEIRLNLEFLADRQVLLSGCEPKHYQFNLMQLSYQKKLISITNNFNVSFLKNRIIMMNKVKSKSLTMLKYALIAPLIICLTGINVNISAQTQSAANSMVSAKAETPTATVANPQQPPAIPNTSKNEDVYESVDKSPEFSGGLEALNKFLSDNVRYPAEAQKKQIQEKITVKFVVEKDGSVSDVQAIRGKDKSLKQEAVRVVSMLPKFQPGSQKGVPVRVYYVVNINFKLQIAKPQKLLIENALIVLDGKEISYSDYQKIDMKTIKSTDVLKDQSAIERYGDKGKNGVIILTSK